MCWLKDARNALVESISVWQDKENIEPDMRSFGATKCPLCVLYYEYIPRLSLQEMLDRRSCKQCPIAQLTKPFCKNTPYTAVLIVHGAFDATHAEKLDAIRAMVKRLQDILVMFDKEHGHRVIR
jgi:hypothetical protein